MTHQRCGPAPHLSPSLFLAQTARWRPPNRPEYWRENPTAPRGQHILPAQASAAFASRPTAVQGTTLRKGCSTLPLPNRTGSRLGCQNAVSPSSSTSCSRTTKLGTSSITSCLSSQNLV